MLTKSRKYLKNSTLLLIIGVLLLLGCPASGDQTTVLPISSSIPASGATNFSADGNIVLTYNQAVVKGEGVITLLTYLPSVGKRVTIAIDDTQVSIAGNVVTIDPPIDLDMGISYILTIPAGVFLNAAGGNAIPADTLFFSTAPAIDITAPAISAAMSVGGATDLSANADIILTFDEPILKGSGEIILTPTVGAPLVIAVSDPRVTIVGGVVTIDPMADLALDTAYTLTIPAGAFVDASGNSSPPDTQSFMTAMALDTTLPTVNSSVPANNATGVAVDANIVLTYDEAVQKGSGSITLQPTGGTVVTIPISTAQVSVAGSVVTINPTVDLLAGTDYTLMVPAGVIDDLAGNSAGSLTLNFATAAAADITPPTINSSAPTSGATINAFDNIVLMYSEAVQKGSGSITLQPLGGTLVTIPISSAQVSVVASVVAIDPTADLVAGTAYTLSFPAGVFQDLAGNNAGSFTLNFSTAVPLDTTAPTISSRVPANNAMNVNIGANVVLTYNEAVQKGSGSITLQRSGGGMVTIPVSSAQVSVSGSVVTINPTADLLAGTVYTLSFSAGVFLDLAGNNAGSLTLNFSTAAALDTTPPTISSSVPANGATGVAVGANIVLTYSEAVQKGSGSMTISSGGGMVTISVSSALVSVSGAVVTINPTADLLAGIAYTLSFPAGVFQDLAGNNAGSLTLNFSTAAALDTTPPTIASSAPVAGGTIETTANIVLTYNEAVQKGSGSITITASGGTTVTIPLSSSQVSVAGAVVTIDPTAALTLTTYALVVPAGAIEDSSGNTSGEYTLSFVAQATMIQTVADLDNVRNNLDGDYVLAANIDLSSIDNWQPIGDFANPFTGSFDGQDYQISGLNSSGYQYAGLFGVATGGSISNLGVLVGTISSSSASGNRSAAGGLVGRAFSGSSISNSYVVAGDISSSAGDISSSSSAGNSYVGGLVGMTQNSPISNSYVVAGDISSSSLSSSFSSSFAGGLVGIAFFGSSISNSYVVAGDISSSATSSSSSRAGGLAGEANHGSPISNSFAVVGGNISSFSSSLGSVAGGLVGFLQPPVSNSYVVVGGNISSSSSSSSSDSINSVAGGLAGFGGSSISNFYAVVGGNISSSSSSGDSVAGGLIGNVGSGSSISNSYYSASRQSSEGNFTNTEGTSQTVAQLRALTATGTGWMAFYDASSAPAHALITDTSVTFATGDRRLWHFGDNAQLPILHPSPAQVTASDLSLYRARQHFVATASSTTQVNLSWSSAGATYTFYEVHRHTANNSSGATRVGSPQVSAVGRTYADTGLTTATTYYYWLKACAGSVCSDFFANTQTTTP